MSGALPALRSARGSGTPVGTGSHLAHRALPVAVGLAAGGAAVASASAPPRYAGLLVAAATVPLLAVLLGDLRRVLLALVLLDIPLARDVNISYTAKAAQYGAFYGYNLSVTTICLAGLYGLWLADALAPRTRAPRLALRIALPFGAYVLFTALSALVAENRQYSLFEIFLVIQMLLVLVYVASNVRTLRDVRFVVALLLLGLILESAVGIARVGGIGRLVGTLGSPNVAGAFFASLLAPALSVFATPLGSAYRRLALTAFVLGLFALFLTFSRGAWLGTLLSLAILAVIAVRRGWLRLTPGLLAGVAAIIVVIPFIVGAIESRLATAQSPAGRITLMRLAWQMIQDHPLFGVGANNFPVAIFHYLTPEFDGTWIYSVHNKLLLVWSEAGLFALLAFVWFLVATLRYGLRATRSSDPVLAPLAAGFLGAFAGQIVHMQVDPFRSRSEIQMLCVMCGLLAAMDRIRRQETA